MAGFRLLLVLGLCLIQTASAYKLLSLLHAYLLQDPLNASGSLAKSVGDQEELPVYRDLPPFKRKEKDLTEALEATRNLQFLRPPFDSDRYYAGLKKAAEEVRSLVVGVAAAPLSAIQLSKASLDSLGNPASKIGSEQELDSKSRKVKRQAIDKPEDGAEPSPSESKNVHVNVDVPYTNVQVRKGAGIEDTDIPPLDDVNGQPLSNPLGDVGVSVEAPFTNVQVRGKPLKHGANVGVHVEAPFVKVKVDGSAAIERPTALETLFPTLSGKSGFLSSLPKGPAGKPLDLDINIPGIFNLKLLRDETGRGRLGIGVLPIISSFVNPHKTLESYPGPPS